MCCCGKPVVNGNEGYSWDGKSFGVRPVNPPELGDNEKLIYDEPGRCGGLDSHCHHYRVVWRAGSLWLLVRHGGGDERMRLSGPLCDPLAAMDSTARYWMLNAIFHANHNGARDAQIAESLKWRKAANDKRIKTRKLRGTDQYKVWIDPQR